MKPSNLKAANVKRTSASIVTSAVVAVTAGAFAANALAADPPTGKQLFERYCAQCHAPGYGHPGTMQLERVRGKALAVLEERNDLVAAYVTTVVRNGLVEMPPYRPTEIDDAALATLVKYLTAAKPGAKQR